MPFTGSMAPDAPYYAPLGVWPSLTHSLLGVVTVDLLIGVVAYLLWHRLLVEPLLALSPPALTVRLDVLGGTGPRRSASAWAGVAAALAVGALTHVVWDDFTHVGRWGTEHVWFLPEKLGPLEGYRWARYASGVLGALALAVAAWRGGCGPTRLPRLDRLPRMPRPATDRVLRFR